MINQVKPTKGKLIELYNHKQQIFATKTISKCMRDNKSDQYTFKIVIQQVIINIHVTNSIAQ